MAHMMVLYNSILNSECIVVRGRLRITSCASCFPTTLFPSINAQAAVRQLEAFELLSFYATVYMWPLSPLTRPKPAPQV